MFKIELNIYKRIGVTKEVYEILRQQKKKQKKSMARIICDLVLKNFRKEK